jgi:hypothetical protein
MLNSISVITGSTNNLIVRRIQFFKRAFLALVIVFSSVSSNSCEAALELTLQKRGITKPGALGVALNLISLFGLDFGSQAANKMDLTVTATPTNVDFTLVGGAIEQDFDDILVINGSREVTLPDGNTAIQSLWKGQFALNLNAGQLSDDMSINGFIQHTHAPHATDQNFGPQLTFNTVVDADNEVNGFVHSKVASYSKLHPDFHYDVFKGAELTATVTGSVFEDITGYTFSSGAYHVPEPASCTLVAAISFCALGFRRHKKRLHKTSREKKISI